MFVLFKTGVLNLQGCKHEKVSLSMSKKIAQARCEKKLSQKDLSINLVIAGRFVCENFSPV